ncbi:MAG: helix-turn-helix domain-containing protein [Planctomycetota bacterium]
MIIFSNSDTICDSIFGSGNLLCEEDVSIKQAAMQTGFSSDYYFCRVFKDIFGHSPGRIKKYLRRDLNHF